MPTSFCIECGAPCKGSRCRRHRLRRTLSAARKRQIKQRDGWRCTHVDEHGARCVETHDLHVDHIVPLSRGGTDLDSNLATLCSTHNLAKGDR